MTLKGHGCKQQRFISCSLSMPLAGLHYHVGGCRLNSTSSLTQTDGAHHRPGPHGIQALALLGPRKKESLCTGSEKLLPAFHWPKQSRGLATFQSYAGWKEDWEYLCTALMRHTLLHMSNQLCAFLSSISAVRWVWTSHIWLCSFSHSFISVKTDIH